MDWQKWAAIVGIAAVLVPGGYWYVGQFETVSAAETMKAGLEAETAKHAAEDRQRAVDAARAVAWLAVGQARIDWTLARNRINDCNTRKNSGKPLGVVEINACRDYQVEYDAAVKRFEKAQEEAQAASRGKAP